jgi:hypothetical protein
MYKFFDTKAKCKTDSATWEWPAEQFHDQYNFPNRILPQKFDTTQYFEHLFAQACHAASGATSSPLVFNWRVQKQPCRHFLNNITRRLQRELHTLGDHYVRSSQTKRNITRVSALITWDLPLTKFQTITFIMNCRDYQLLLPTDLFNSWKWM